MCYQFVPIKYDRSQILYCVLIGWLSIWHVVVIIVVDKMCLNI